MDDYLQFSIDAKRRVAAGAFHFENLTGRVRHIGIVAQTEAQSARMRVAKQQRDSSTLWAERQAHSRLVAPCAIHVGRARFARVLNSAVILQVGWLSAPGSETDTEWM